MQSEELLMWAMFGVSETYLRTISGERKRWESGRVSERIETSATNAKKRQDVVDQNHWDLERGSDK